MSYYCLHVPINSADVQIIREEFQEYLHRADSITVRITSPNGEGPSEALEDAMRGVILHLLIAISNDGFEGLH
jgi:hypothetical protein